jgi:hypothetical protein
VQLEKEKIYKRERERERDLASSDLFMVRDNTLSLTRTILLARKQNSKKTSKSISKKQQRESSRGTSQNSLIDSWIAGCPAGFPGLPWNRRG